MRFFKFTYHAEEHQRFMWVNCDWLSVLIDCHTWICPDEQYRDTVSDNGVNFRINAITRQGSLNLSALDERIQRALREWSVTGAVRLLNIEETTLDDCIGAYSHSLRTRPVRDIARGLLAEEYFTVRMERDFIDEYIAIDHEDEGGTVELPSAYATALCRELDRINAKKPTINPIDNNPRTSIMPAHYLIEGISQSEYRPIVDILVDALYRAERVSSRSVTVIDFDRMIGSNVRYSSSFEYFYECLNDAFVQSLAGGNVVIRYGCLDKGDSFDLDAYRALMRLIDAVSVNPDCAQCFFVVPNGAHNLEERIARRIKVPLVEIARNKPLSVATIEPSGALNELCQRAKKEGLVVDDDLSACFFKHIQKDPYADLDIVYRDWSRAKRTADFYPAYLPLVRQNQDRLCATHETALQRLNKLIGLEEPKRRIRELILRTEMNEELKGKGLDAIEFSRHMVFTGAPGTGKTEVARLFGEILREKRVLSEGRLITMTGAQLGAGKMTELFEKARGSVLFVDEAYALAGAFMTVSQLISCMENYREEVVVILAGYRESMEALMSCNAGFRSRIGCTIDFPDYTDEEKVAIFDFMSERSGLVLTEDARAAVRNVVSRGGTRDDEGNARFVRNLFENACGRQQVRLASNRPNEGWTEIMLRTLTEEDIGECRCVVGKTSGREELDQLVGLSNVKRLVSDRLDFMRIQKARRDRDLPTSFIPMHFAFTGSPGTGKTEVARLIGRILKEEGVLSVGDVYECGKQDLVGQAVGQTAPKVAALFRQAKGSVIFIDEAYSLCQCQGGYDEEAVTAIIDQMEKLREEVVVILAGYPDEVALLLDKNPGFRSRINAQIEFPDYTATELCKILVSMASNAGMSLGDDALTKACEIINKASSKKGFGNARFVRNLLEDAIIAQGARLVRSCAEAVVRLEDLSPEAFSILEKEDFEDFEASGEGARRSIGFLS